jgi:hypothetical protein
LSVLGALLHLPVAVLIQRPKPKSSSYARGLGPKKAIASNHKDFQAPRKNPAPGGVSSSDVPLTRLPTLFRRQHDGHEKQDSGDGVVEHLLERCWRGPRATLPAWLASRANAGSNSRRASLISTSRRQQHQGDAQPLVGIHGRCLAASG